MKNCFNSLPVILFLFSILVLPGCADNSQWEKEGAGLLSRAVELERRHCQLNASIDSLWDATSAQLAVALPPDFPPVDRKIFLKARNADHIRMFMSFKKLDAGAKALVDQAGQQDKILAAQVRTLLEQKQEFEQQKIEFLREVEEKDAATSRIIAGELREGATGICQ